MLENNTIGLESVQSTTLEATPRTFRERVTSLIKPILHNPRNILEKLETTVRFAACASLLTFYGAGALKQGITLGEKIGVFSSNPVNIEPFNHASSVIATSGFMACTMGYGHMVSRTLENRGNKTWANIARHASTALGILLTAGYQYTAKLSEISTVFGVPDQTDFIYGVAAIVPSYLLLRKAFSERTL